MRTFTPGNRETPELRRLASDIQRAGMMAQPFILLDVLHIEPDRPQNGMTALADGTDWNPGLGQGVYTYYAAAWHKLG